MRRLLKALGVLLLTIIVLVLVLFLATDREFRHDRDALISGARIGWPENKVVAHLGEPTFIAHKLEDLDIVTPGWAPIPTRAVTKEVLVYDRMIWRVYVYIDKQNKVEYVLLART